MSGPRVPVSARGGKSSVLMHAVDWAPTILHFIDDESFKSEIDGIDLYDSIIYTNSKSKNLKQNVAKRDLIPVNIDIEMDISDETDGKYLNTAIRSEKYKLIYNIEKLENCDVFSPKPRKYPFSSDLIENSMNNGDNMFLFDLENDPYETNDLLNGKGKDSPNYDKYESIIEELTKEIDKFVANGYETMQDATPLTAGLANKHGGSWIPWK